MGIWRRSAYANLAGVYNRASSHSKHYGCDPMPGIEPVAAMLLLCRTFAVENLSHEALRSRP
jgi:hypothetical protein